MERGPGARPLLPQTFQFAPPNFGLGDTKKHYVFVDEHNRHKRLKVMRACEGCRRRKIKCDAATTNTWPCAACVRLKLQCVPPTVNYDRNHSVASHIPGLERVLDFDNSSGGSGDEDYPSASIVSHAYHVENPSEMINPSQAAYTSGIDAFHTSPYVEKMEGRNHIAYENTPSLAISVTDSPYQNHPTFQISRSLSMSVSTQPVENGSAWGQEDVSAENLSKALGELKIDETGVAPYIFQQKKTLAGAPALEEYEISLPTISFGSGATVSIPTELMPGHEQVMQYFDIFFTKIHPYVPVVSKSYFYQQWHRNPKSISPLLLEAIFACAGRMSEDATQGAKWLAVASKYENCFMDVPRLSTIQALLILLKARESAPKRGYYFRSWMSIKTIITMAKDLELHEHYADHREGRGCGSDPIECRVKTRIWQNICLCEMMVGGPQGRFDMGVDTETVDVSVPDAPPESLDEEDLLSRNFTYLTRIARNVRILNDIYFQIRKQKNWGSDPRFVNLNPMFEKWEEQLPADLQVHYPSDGSPPMLPNHFIGNLHCYYHLSIIMLHRPQLMNSSSFAAGGSWKQHMALCYSSAKSLCRLQEALWMTHGQDGFVCMQRGVNFAIYCILTCTMLHLVAITSPDPDFSSDAKEYFTRHMQILESCTTNWPMQEMQAQIQSLREAFSADTTKPFVLKPSFPYGSPPARFQPSPPLESHYSDDTLACQSTSEQMPALQGYASTPMTPPISAHHDDPSAGSLAAVSLTMMAASHRQQPPMPNGSLEDEDISWNPTRIFEYDAKSSNRSLKLHMVRSPANLPRSQWTTAFGTPNSTNSATASSMSQNSPTIYTQSPVSVHDLPTLHDAMQQQYPLLTNMPPTSQMPSIQPTSYPSISHSFVSPTMWQDTVASTYDPNTLKRRWNMESSYFNDQQQVKRPR